MRTDLILDDDLASELEKLARSTDQSLNAVVNEMIRKGLSVGEKPDPALPPFEVKPISSPFQPGVDIHNLNRLFDELEIEDFQ